MMKTMWTSRLSGRKHAVLAVSCALTGACAQSAAAQVSCVWTTLQDPVRQVIRCGDSFTLEREATTGLSIVPRSDGTPPRLIELQDGAAYITVEPGAAPTQIRTPHAIAAVRGTTYLVDAGRDETSVFVIEGQVAVRKQNDASFVTLGPGEGVDVASGVSLRVVTWGAARVAALLERFGR